MLEKKNDWHTHVYTSTYAADVSGCCSMMYELGGMTVLHDPSGCNSTYTTHDEPRWYGQKSLMFISGLDEMAAIMGDDAVIINDVATAAKDLKPRFITLCGASIPHVIAFDYPGVARLIEKRTGVPVIPVATDGLRSYVHGAGLAGKQWIARFASENVEKVPGSVNILGATPLDFGDMRNIDAMKNTLEEAGFRVNCCFAMGASFEECAKVYQAECNVVVSACGRMAARYMYGRKRIPFVEGIPTGEIESGLLRERINEAIRTNKNQVLQETEDETYDTLVIGEEITALSLAEAIRLSCGRKVKAVYPDDHEGIVEKDLIDMIALAKTVVCDPLYQVICRGKKIVPLPHVAYSGRIYSKDIPVFCDKSFNVRKLLEGERK